jgi:hypothetical protein
MTAAASGPADAVPAGPRGGVLAALAGAPTVAWAMAALFAALGFLAVERDVYLNDEGVLTWMLAGLTGESPLDLLFLLKARPPISAFYAPVAQLGLMPFLYAHVAVAALAIPLLANLARRFGQARPNLPAALLALSPLYFGSAAAGVQNTEAVLGLLAVTWLMVRGAPLSAGVLGSLLVLGRAETLVFVFAFALYALLHPGRRGFVIAAAAVPLLYVPLGALYHGDVWWPLRYPPSLGSNPTIPSSVSALYGGNLGDLVITLVGLTPALGALLWLPWRGRPALERTAVGTAIAFVVILRLLPFFEVINFDAGPRYVLPALPFLCLGIGSAIETWPRRSARRTLWRSLLLLGLAAAGCFVLDPLPLALLALAAAGCAVAAPLALHSARAAIASILAIAVVLAAPPSPHLRLMLGDQAQVLEEITRWLRMIDLPRGATVATDYSLLRIWTERHAPELQLDIRFLAPPDIRYEIETLADPATGQLQAFTGSTRFFYAPWLTEDELAAMPGDVHLVLRVENSRREDLARPPLQQVEWLFAGRWRGGRLPAGASPVRGAHPDAAGGAATRPPGR